ncbi:MAG: MerR family transcriptional regulator [Myxococcota bacterium]
MDMPATQRGEYRIGTVARLTGVDPHTIRAWERRYGAIAPRRTEGGTRLYSEGDVQRLRLLKAVTDAGDAIGVVATLVDEELHRRLITLRGPQPTRNGSGQPDMHGVVDALLEAINRYDGESVDKLLGRAARLAKPTELYLEVIRPFMSEVGERWNDGRLNVAQEHLASQRVESIVRALLDTMTSAAPRGEALLACIDEEQHELPLYGVALNWASHGLRIRFLGARTPVDAIAEAVRALRPAVVGLSMTVVRERAEAARLFRSYGEALTGNVPWVVGGRAALEHRESIERVGGERADDDGTTTVRGIFRSATL